MAQRMASVCVLPPTRTWPMLQRQRCFNDRGFVRWPPHIRLLEKQILLNDELLQPFSATIADAVSCQLKPFEVTLRGFKHFEHPNSYTLWLDVESPELLVLQSQLAITFPDFVDDSHPYTPHLKVAQAATLNELHDIQKALEDSWTPLRFPVSEVAILMRTRFLEPFTVRETVPLGQPHACGQRRGAADADAPANARARVRRGPYVATLGPLQKLHLSSAELLDADTRAHTDTHTHTDTQEEGSDTELVITSSVTHTAASTVDTPVTATATQPDTVAAAAASVGTAVMPGLEPAYSNGHAASDTGRLGMRVGVGVGGGEDGVEQGDGTVPQEAVAEALATYRSQRQRHGSIREGVFTLSHATHDTLIALDSAIVGTSQWWDDIEGYTSNDNDLHDSSDSGDGSGSETAREGSPEPREPHAGFMHGADTRGASLSPSPEPVVAVNGGSRMGAEVGETVWYFAYGPDMSARKLRMRGVAPLQSQPAVLSGYALTFNHRGGVVNILPAADLARRAPYAPAYRDAADGAGATGASDDNPLSCVHGVAHLLTVEDMARVTLGTWEHWPCEADVQPYATGSTQSNSGAGGTSTGRVRAVLHVSPPERQIRLGLPPSNRYVGQLVSAAQEGGLSAAYIEWLRQLESVDAESRDAVHYLSAPTGELLGAWPRTMRTGSEKVLAATKSGPVRRKPASASSSNGSKRQEGTQTPVQEKPVTAKKNVETMAA